MKRVLFLLAAVIALGTALTDAAGPCGCNCSNSCKTYCRLVCTMKSELTFDYSMDCDQYCHLGPSDKCGKKKVCDNGILGFHWETIWKPNCSCVVREKRTLVKVPVVKQVPVYTCVVERVCDHCGCRHADARATQHLQEAGIVPVSAEMPLVELNEDLRPIAPLPANSAAAELFAAPAVPQRNTVEAK